MKRLVKFMITVLTLGLLVGCGGTKGEISSEMQEKMGTKADEIIKLFNEEKIEEIYMMGSEKFKEVVTVEKLKEATNQIYSVLGKVKEQKGREFGEKDGYYICVTLGELEKGRGQIQTSFNKDMELEGFAIVK